MSISEIATRFECLLTGIETAYAVLYEAQVSPSRKNRHEKAIKNRMNRSAALFYETAV